MAPRTWSPSVWRGAGPPVSRPSPTTDSRQSVIPVAEELGSIAVGEQRWSRRGIRPISLARAEATCRGGRDASGRNQLDRVEALDGDIHEIRSGHAASGRTRDGRDRRMVPGPQPLLEGAAPRPRGASLAGLDPGSTRRPADLDHGRALDRCRLRRRQARRPKQAAVRHAGEPAALAVTSADPEIHLWVPHAAGAPYSTATPPGQERGRVRGAGTPRPPSTARSASDAGDPHVCRDPHRRSPRGGIVAADRGPLRATRRLT